MAPLEFLKPTNEKRGPLLIDQSEAGVPCDGSFFGQSPTEVIEFGTVLPRGHVIGGQSSSETNE